MGDSSPMTIMSPVNEEQGGESFMWTDFKLTRSTNVSMSLRPLQDQAEESQSEKFKSQSSILL